MIFRSQSYLEQTKQGKPKIRESDHQIRSYQRSIFFDELLFLISGISVYKFFDNMIKLNSDSPLSTSSRCTLCQPQTKQHRCIIKTLLNRIKNFLSTYHSSFNTHPLYPQNEPFSQIARILNLSPGLPSHQITACKHRKWYRLFKDLKTDVQVVSLIIQKLCDKLSEREYHLWLVESQVKNVIDSLASRTFHQPLPQPQPTHLTNYKSQTSTLPDAPPHPHTATPHSNNSLPIENHPQNIIFYRNQLPLQQEPVDLNPNSVGVYFAMPYYYGTGY